MNKLEPDHSSYLKELSPRWGELTYGWQDNQGNRFTYVSSVELATKDIYGDGSSFIIAKKCAALILVRPIHTLVMTLYHATLLGVGHHLWHYAAGNQDGTSCIKNCAKSLADIIRTPLYGIVLTVLAAVSALSYPLIKDRIFDLRTVMGKIEQSLFWGERHASATLAHCFQPMANLNTIADHHRWKIEQDCIAYPADATPTEKALANLAHAHTLKLNDLHERCKNFAILKSDRE